MAIEFAISGFSGDQPGVAIAGRKPWQALFSLTFSTTGFPGAAFAPTGSGVNLKYPNILVTCMTPNSLLADVVKLEAFGSNVYALTLKPIDGPGVPWTPGVNLFAIFISQQLAVATTVASVVVPDSRRPIAQPAGSELPPTGKP